MSKIYKSAVGIRFFGETLDPDELTTLLGAEPTRASRTGDINVTSTGKRILARSGSWLIGTDDRTPGDIEAQIAELFAKLSPEIGIWTALSDRFSSDIFIGLFMEAGNEGFELGPESLAEVSARGLRLAFDVYGPDCS